MPSPKPKIRFQIHEFYKENHDIVDDVDFGRLMMRLGSHQYARMYDVSFRRTAEVELALAIVGLVGLMSKSFFETLGQELAKWLVEELKRRSELKKAEIQAGNRIIVLGRRDEKAARSPVEKLLRFAQKNSLATEIRMIRKKERRFN